MRTTLAITSRLCRIPSHRFINSHKFIDVFPTTHQVIENGIFLTCGHHIYVAISDIWSDLLIRFGVSEILFQVSFKRTWLLSTRTRLVCGESTWTTERGGSADTDDCITFGQTPLASSSIMSLLLDVFTGISSTDRLTAVCDNATTLHTTPSSITSCMVTIYRWSQWSLSSS